MVAVFREVWRVLRDDGTLWLNLGDSYTSGNRDGHGTRVGYKQQTNRGMNGTADPPRAPQPPGLKPKDLVGIPWMVAFALRADGWYLRSDIIWAKKNCMPESVRDRPTRSHEYVFLFSKSPRYYFDQDAVREGVPQVPGVEAADGFLSAPKSPELRLGLQGVREGTGEGVASAGRGGERKGSSQALRTNGARPSKASGVRKESDTQGAASGLPQERDGASGVTQSRGDRGREGAKAASRTDGEGQGIPCPDEGEASSCADDRSDADGRRVGGDLEGGRRAVRVLRDGGDVDDGSHRSAGEGWQAHEGERGAGVQALQQSQEGSSGRNIRSVWHVATQPFPGAHFATFPPKLIEPCILAGSPPKCCGECGAPWERVRERTGRMIQQQNGPDTVKAHIQANGAHGATSSLTTGYSPEYETTGWRSTCDHDDDTGTATVLDPFNGAGTTGLVALRHDRDYVGIELNPEYAQMARDRITDDAPLLNVEAA